jgi:hypothetical protein
VGLSGETLNTVTSFNLTSFVVGSAESLKKRTIS